MTEPIRRRRSRIDRRSDFQRILAGAGGVWRRHAWFFVAAALLFQFPCGIYLFLVLDASGSLEPNWFLYGAFAWVTQSAHFFASAFVYGAVAQSRQGSKVRYGESVRAFFDRLVPVVGTCLAAGWIVGLLRFLPDVFRGGAFLLSIFFVVIGLIVLCAFWLAGVVAVTQPGGPITALRESVRLTARRKATIFSVVLVLGMINVVGDLFLPHFLGLKAGLLASWGVRVVVDSVAVVACCIAYEMFGDSSKRLARVFE